jgi:xanthine dehydrogenase YagR molybdenum-binding subunit
MDDAMGGDNIGRSQTRYEAIAKVTGAAKYASDEKVSAPAYAFLVTSSIGKGKIVSINEDGARALPGVLDIFTHQNTGELKEVSYSPTGGGSSTSLQGFGPEIAHDGQIVAMVVAETFETARDAAYRLDVRYDAETPSATFGASGLDETSAGVMTSALTRTKEWLETGNAESAFSNAPVRLDERYGTPPQHHNPIELFTTTCVWDGDKLTVYEPSQFVYGLKNTLAQRLGIDPTNVRVVSRYVGGAFGSKAQMTPRTGLVALAARRLRRAVKLVATRDQGFTIATYRAETQHHVRLGAERDGKIVAYVHEGWELTSRPDDYSVEGTDDTSHLYHYGAVKTHVNIVHADRNTPGFMRSPPVVPYVYALESALDELAYALDMDPVELRRRNDTGVDSFGGKWSSRSLMTCYDTAAKAFGWSKRNPRPMSMRDGEWLIGWGCATAVYPTHVAAATLRLRLFASGEAIVQTAAHDIGTGAYTVIAQMAAEEFGIAFERVKVELGDSDLPPAPVAGGSNTTASVCSTLLRACNAMKAKALQGAGQVAAVQGDGRTGSIDSSKVDLVALMQRMGSNALEQYVEFVPEGATNAAIGKLYKGQPTLVGGAHGKNLMYAHGAEFVELRIHARTREVRCTRAVGAFAAGRIMNAMTARSQLMGGMIWGVASALHEATELDEMRARYINDNLADYLIPVNADIGEVDVHIVPEIDHQVNPAGVKGLGELGNVGTAAAVTNAVFHATGVRIRELPVRIEKLLV